MDTAIQQLLESGLLGVLLVLSIGAIVFLYRELNKITGERIADYKEVIQQTHDAQTEQRTLLTQILDLIKRDNGK